MKNQKGISLVTLIVTIIVIIILAAIVITSSFNKNLDEAVFTRIVSEMTEVYDAVVQRTLEHELDSDMYQYVGTNLKDDPIEINGVVYGEGYYYIETQEHKEQLNLERVLGKYVVNYDTSDIISETRISYEGSDYHRFDDLVAAVQPETTRPAVGEYDKEQGVNKPVLSDGMVPVKQEGGVWVATTRDDSEWYDYANGKYATIMLMDELELQGYSNDELRALSKDELEEELANREVLVEGSSFVWIPRYTYKQDASTGEVDIVYSNLTLDYLNNGYVKNPAFYFGEYQGANSDLEGNSGYVGGGKELTGIWVSKYEAGFSN